jgi:hypothetical protein
MECVRPGPLRRVPPPALFQSSNPQHIPRAGVCHNYGVLWSCVHHVYIARFRGAALRLSAAAASPIFTCVCSLRPPNTSTSEQRFTGALLPSPALGSYLIFRLAGMRTATLPAVPPRSPGHSCCAHASAIKPARRRSSGVLPLAAHVQIFRCVPLARLVPGMQHLKRRAIPLASTCK